MAVDKVRFTGSTMGVDKFGLPDLPAVLTGSGLPDLPMVLTDSG